MWSTGTYPQQCDMQSMNDTDTHTAQTTEFPSFIEVFGSSGHGVPPPSTNYLCSPCPLTPFSANNCSWLITWIKWVASRENTKMCVAYRYSGSRIEKYKYIGFLILTSHMRHVNLTVSSQWVAALDMKWIFKFVPRLRMPQPSLIQYFQPGINLNCWCWLGMNGVKFNLNNFNFNTVEINSLKLWKAMLSWTAM